MHNNHIRIPFLDLKEINRPFEAEFDKAFQNVIASGRYIGGEEVNLLEQEIAQLCKTQYAVGVSNGLDALRLILRGYIELGKLNPGDKVIVPANTYIASMLAVTDAGLRLIPVDVDNATMNISTEFISEDDLATAKAIMPVHLYGRMAWDAKLKALVEQNNLLVIEDVAQALGAKSNIKGLFESYSAGGLGHAAGLSFYPTKNIGALGDGGMVTTNDPDLAYVVRALANYGSDCRYHNIYIGYNCRLDALQAAFLRIKLRQIERINGTRRENAKIYAANIQNPLITTPQIPEYSESHVWHQYVIRTNGTRDKLRAYLNDNGIETDVHYPTPPLHQPCYSNLKCEHNFANTDSMAGSIISLPISEALSQHDIKLVSQIINGYKE